MVDEYNQITDHEGKIKIFKYDVYMMQYISLLNARTNFPLDSSTTPYPARAMKMRCVYQQFWHRRHNSTVEIAFGGGDDISCDAMLNTAASSIKGLRYSYPRNELIERVFQECEKAFKGHTASLQHPKQRPCNVAVENKADYHYEVIESAIMQFPLPWGDMKCVTRRMLNLT